MSYAEDLSGRRFGRLFVLSRNYDMQKEIYIKTGKQIAFWNCVCDCGNQKVIKSSNLKNRRNPTMSCGCLCKEQLHKQKNTKENQWIINDDETIGITTSGKKFFIDTEDLELAKQYCWRIDKQSGYVIANSRNGENKIIWLHRLVMGVTNKEIYVDHSDWNKRNNKKSNLRIATKSENNMNIKRKSNNTSGYTGVTINKRTGKFVARISKNNKRFYLGSFETFEEAVKVRHKAEMVMHNKWSGEINRKDYKYDM